MVTVELAEQDTDQAVAHAELGVDRQRVYRCASVPPRLQRIGDDVFTATASHSMLGLHLGARMTVVRLPDGGLWVHSPIELADELRSELDALGPVRHIVGPNLFHHVYLGPMVEAYPEAKLHGAPDLAKKRKDLRFTHELAASADGQPWSDVFEQVLLAGCMLGEVVFYHRPSRMVIAADLIENFTTSDHWPTRLYLKAAGIHGKPGVSRMLRPIYRDRVKVRDSLDRILAWGFDRVVISHGDLIDENGPAVVRESYRWL